MLLFDTHDQRRYVRLDRPSDETMLDTLQSHIGGYIEAIPSPLDQDGDEVFTVYANEDGMRLNLAPNYLAWGVLHELGFRDSAIGRFFYYGNVVLLGPDESALTGAAIQRVEAALERYLANAGDTEDMVFVHAKRPDASFKA